MHMCVKLVRTIEMNTINQLFDIFGATLFLTFLFAMPVVVIYCKQHAIIRVNPGICS